MKIKKYWYWYLLGVAAATYVITSLVKEEWNPMNWFALPATGRYANPNSTSRQACKDQGGGDCTYNGLSVPCSECRKRGVVVEA